jgi:hypothetical protein
MLNRTMSTPRREIAGVTVPDISLVARSMEEARALSEPYLFNHAVRSWLFAVQLAELQGLSYDEEVVAVASLLHDVGLTSEYQGNRRSRSRERTPRKLWRRPEAWMTGELSSSGTALR